MVIAYDFSLPLSQGTWTSQSPSIYLVSVDGVRKSRTLFECIRGRLDGLSDACQAILGRTTSGVLLCTPTLTKLSSYSVEEIS
jgi:hypothetical protein